MKRTPHKNCVARWLYWLAGSPCDKCNRPEKSHPNLINPVYCDYRPKA